MENRNNTKNAGRKPFAVLYSAADKNQLPIANVGNRDDEDKDSFHKKASFIIRDDSQDENSGIAVNREIIETKPPPPLSIFILNDDDVQDENAVVHPHFEPSQNRDFNLLSDHHDDESFHVDNNDADLDHGEKKKFVFYLSSDDEDQDDNGDRVSIVDHEMSELKSRSSILCVSMRSAASTTTCDSTELTEKEIQQDIIFSCRDYAQDIHSYLRELEKKYRPKIHYIGKQPEIGEEMRSVLIDWLVDVSSEYGLHQETLHLAVGYTDRFLSFLAVHKQHLQLVGIAAMMIAAKYEEIYPPELHEFVYITDDSYSKWEVLKMEQMILKTLDFNLTSPTALVFLISYLKASRVGQRCQHLAMYLCDLALMEYSFLSFLPSLIAASCTFLAHYIADGILGAATVQKVSGYSIADIYPCVHALLVVFKNASSSKQQALRDKYREDKYCRVSLLECPESLPSLESFSM